MTVNEKPLTPMSQTNHQITRWQDVPAIKVLRDELFVLTGSNSLASSLFGRGYHLPDEKGEPGKFVNPSERTQRVEWLKSEITRLRNEWIVEGMRQSTAQPIIHIDER